jgi:hypothetical protein
MNAFLIDENVGFQLAPLPLPLAKARGEEQEPVLDRPLLDRWAQVEET